jgi:hypothetical protein
MGAKGVCLSACLPTVSLYASMLPTEGCDVGEVCTPCVNPMDGVKTGACQVFACQEQPTPTESAAQKGAPNNNRGDDKSKSQNTPAASSCDNPPTKPIVDVSVFASCCDGARCIPKSFVPATMTDDLSSCGDGNSLCVPDAFVASGGYFTPETCTFPGDVEGRCLSTCLSTVQEKLASLPVAGCPKAHRCVPCCDPMTGESTGACTLGCDAGPKNPTCKATWAACCGGEGHCMPAEMVAKDKQANLDAKGCEKGSLCVPDVLQDPNFKPQTCSGKILFKQAYTGVCLPKCLKIPLDALIWKGTCDKADDCVPCDNPLTGESTGAPGCPAP